MRIQADPNALAVRGIGIDTLAAAIGETNVNQATGTLNGASDAQIIRTDGQSPRPLPFDAQYRRKPACDAIAASIASAPAR